MTILCRYAQGDKARFDFRISDGMGNLVEPDWDDPNLRVEIFDSAGTLRATATKNGSPSLAASADSHGKFLYTEEIGLNDFSLGVAAAKIYCRVSAAEVLPYPTVLEAFEVVAGTGSEPSYTTVDRVRSELPPDLPSQLNDAAIERYIQDAGRRIDAFLYGYYQVPLPGIEENPKTPALIERLARKLAVADCLVFLGIVNQSELKSSIEEQALQELDRLRKGELRLLGCNPPVSVYQGEIFQGESGQTDLLE